MVKLLKKYLSDPFLKRLYSEIRQAGSLRSISVDITHECNIRCRGCYFFSEGMEESESPPDENKFDAFIERELERGTNFVTVVGGEPSLMLGRLKKLHTNFHINVSTNGLIKIPYEGFESMPIGVSVWGDNQTDRYMRGGGNVDTFAIALKNYKDDPRAFWYYTVAPGRKNEIERVVEKCINNGNQVLFNFYGDLLGFGGELDSGSGFDEVRTEIDRMISLYPDKMFMSSYLNKIVSTGTLYGLKWGHEVCTSLSANHEANFERLKNGNPYNTHFRAYNADLESTRRCCTGINRSCHTCFDVWEHFSWVILNMKKHIGSKQEFSNWLTTMYLFYLINRLVNFEEGIKLLPEIHKRLGNTTKRESHNIDRIKISAFATVESGLMEITEP